MKKFLLQLIFLFSLTLAFSQNVGIGTNSPNPSAILELKSTDKGFLAPRMDSAQRIAIANPATGLIVYDTDRNTLFLFNGTRWVTIDQTNTGGNPLSRPNSSYTFSSPQFLINYSSPNGISNGHNGITLQSASISENLIVSSQGMDYNTSTFFTTCTFGINRNGTPATIFYTLQTSPAKLFAFDADSLEQNIFAVVGSTLFRLNIANTTDTTRITDNLGNVTQVKVMSNNDIILTTDLNNGSLIKVLQNGTKQTIASNLGYPSYFDVFNTNYYVTGLSAITGTVKRVTPAGAVTTILSDLIAPRSIVFDKNGNFVLQTNVTLGGNVYIEYDLYNANGQLIGPVNDAGDNSILSSSVIPAPLYIDHFNNLVFMHFGTASGTYIPNPVGSNGLWVLKLNKL